MSLYSVRTIGQRFRVVKFDDDLNPLNIYLLARRGDHFSCECFQANKPSCRHRDMLTLFIAKKAVNSGRFYDFETARWLPAIKL